MPKYLLQHLRPSDGVASDRSVVKSLSFNAKDHQEACAEAGDIIFADEKSGDTFELSLNDKNIDCYALQERAKKLNIAD